MSETHRWLGVEVRHLAALDAVVSARSFAGAGRHLGYSQSAISLQIAALERIAGAPLLERPGGRRPVTPTPAGERTLRHARRVLDHMRTAEADLAAIASGQAGTVRLGAFQSARMRLLPRALARLKSARPDLEVRLDEASYQDHLERLAAGALDLAFALLPVEGPFETRELLADPFVFLVADHWARATDQLPPLAALADLPLISWQRGPFSLETMLESHGHDSRVVLRSDDSATVQELVAAGIGAAVLPQLALALPDPRLVLHDASPLLPARRIGLVWHRDRAPVPIVTALKETIEAECQGLQGAPRSGVGVQV